MVQSSGNERVDVLVGGAGLPGLTLALALRQALGTAFSIIVADPSLKRAVAESRASAIVAAARRLFETIGVWEAVEAQPILEMVVTDSRSHDAVKPRFLVFDGDIAPGEPFAHMVENGPLRAALMSQAQAQGIEFRSTAVAGFSPVNLPDRENRANGIEVQFEDGQTICARLLVAADGAASAIRRRAGIPAYGWSYGQSAIVTTVAHERDHHGRACEHFLPAGPFAILPLSGRRSSIVWTEEEREALRIVKLPQDRFHAELEGRFGLELGDLCAAGAREVYPLGFSVARSFIADRIALVADAAHVIHPIAGQGLNSGLKDVAALAETIVDAVRLGLDPGMPTVLERYERWRRFDTVAMGMTTDGLNRLFSNESEILRLSRDIGLGIVDRLPSLKQALIRQAAGLVGDLPKLLRGETL